MTEVQRHQPEIEPEGMANVTPFRRREPVEIGQQTDPDRAIEAFADWQDAFHAPGVTPVALDKPEGFEERERFESPTRPIAPTRQEQTSATTQGADPAYSQGIRDRDARSQGPDQIQITELTADEQTGPAVDAGALGEIHDTLGQMQEKLTEIRATLSRVRERVSRVEPMREQTFAPEPDEHQREREYQEVEHGHGIER